MEELNVMQETVSSTSDQEQLVNDWLITPYKTLL